MKSENLSNTQKITRKNIFDAYALLQLENRFESITVKKICEKSGYNKTTFYNYFCDVYDLRSKLEEMLLKQSDEGSALLSSLTTENDDERLISYFDFFYIPNRLYLQALLGLFGDPEYRIKSAKKISEHLIPLISAVGLSPDDDYSKYLADFYSSGHLSCIKLWLDTDGDISSADIVDILQTVKYDGILSIAKKHAEMSSV